MELPTGESAQGGQRRAAQSHSPTMGEVVRKFLSNTKLHFGENSTEVNSIHHSLGLFLRGNMSKREALSNFQAAIDNQTGLRDDLMAVFNHRDARWAPGDFDIEPTHSQTWPDFMQPSHEPQMRSLPMPPPLFQPHQSNMTNDPTFSNTFGEAHETGYGQNQGLGYTPDPRTHWASWPALESSSPMLQAPSNFGHQNQYASPATGMGRTPWGMSTDNTGSNTNENSWRSYDSNQSFQQPFEPAQSRSFKPSQGSYMAQVPQSPYLVQAPQSPMESPMMNVAPSVPESPYAVPFDRHSTNMPPPMTSIRRPVAPRDQSQEVEGDDAYKPQISSSLPTKAVHNKIAKTPKDIKDDAAVPKTKPDERRFIHLICGKSFASRSKVRKHHWGTKIDDPRTTTGCWAKNFKPNLAWDAHPSCAQATTASRGGKKSAPEAAPQMNQDEEEMISKASNGHGEIAHHGTHQQVPYSQPQMDKPRMVNSQLANPQLFSPQMANTRNAPHQGLQGMEGYHGHRMHSQGSFETLLSAVNTVSPINMPKPQDRNDSVANHLENQVQAMEHQMPRTLASNGSGESAHDSRLPNTNGLSRASLEHALRHNSGAASISPRTAAIANNALDEDFEFTAAKRDWSSLDEDNSDSGDKDPKVRRVSEE